MMPVTETRYTTTQVARIATVTLRQLQWWDEQGIVCPPMEGHRRLYDPSQVFAALLFRELRTRGFSLQATRRVWAQMQKRNFVLPNEQHRWLLTNGERVVLLAEQSTVLAFLEQRRSPAYSVIALEPLLAKMQSAPDVPRLRRGPGHAQLIDQTFRMEVKQA